MPPWRRPTRLIYGETSATYENVVRRASPCPDRGFDAGCRGIRQSTVYGTWFLSVVGFVAVILLIVGLVAYAPIIAVGIALILGTGILWVAAMRRTRQVGAEHVAAAEDRRTAGQTPRPGASGAPVSGEGGAEEAQRAARFGAG